MAASGYVDFFLLNPEAGGLVMCGWVTHQAVGLIHTGEFIARFTGGEARGLGMATYYARAGVESRGVGIVAFIDATDRPTGSFVSFGPADEPAVELVPTASTREIDPVESTRLLAPLLRYADPPLPEMILACLVPPETPIEPPRPAVAVLPSGKPASAASRAPRLVVDLDAIGSRVMLQVDEAVFCPPSGVALLGWMLARPGAVAGIVLRSGAGTTPVDLAGSIPVARPGVIDAVGRQNGFENERCGFLAFVPDGYDPSAASTLEVETVGGPVGARALPPPRLHGLAAIRHLLAECDAQYADVAPAFDGVLGPAVERLNAARFGHVDGGRGRFSTVAFGASPASPDATIVIPLHGRLDFLEIQCALFAADPASAGTEIVYVLDDPRLRRDLENLAASVHARFELPLTLLMHEQNLGFAPACNSGLSVARGRHVCFLNSDAFPRAPGWLGSLAARLDADPGLGVVGPRLLHEDGSVQHEGMEFRPLPRAGGWYFSNHLNLGMRPSAASGLHRRPAITGACMVLETGRARALAGFDEAYVMGDFEDSDLCLRLAAKGLASAVDLDVAMVHLGRRSQPSATERWRMNLILYNAWVHQRRWARAIGDMLTARDEAPAEQAA